MVDNSSSNISARTRANRAAVNNLGALKGRLPPHSIELEQAVLGAVLLEKDALAKVLDAFRPEVFYKPGHQLICEAIRHLFDASEPVDLVMVVEKLRTMAKLEDAGGAFYLAELTQIVASAANIEFHAHLLVEKHVQRTLISTCSELQSKAYDETQDIFELLDQAEQALYALSGDNLRREAQGLDVLTAKTLRYLEELKQKGTGITGITTGFRKLDELTSGWQPSDLIIIAARPAMGKTAFTLSLARNAAIIGKKPVLFFSLEMSSQQLAQRMMVSEAEVDAQKVRTGRLEDYEFQQLMSRVSDLSKAPIYIDDTPSLSINDLRSKCRRMKSEKGIELVIIDYLQLMSGGGKATINRQEEVSKISRSLKMLSKELSIPVIALSQLSRATEQRGSEKRPMLSDLRESGSIEQDADMVIFLYRPEYYGLKADEAGQSTAGVCEIIVGKQRNGPVDTVKLEFISKFGKFQDLIESSIGYGNEYGGYGGLGGGAITLPSRMNEADAANPFEDGAQAPF